MNATEREEKFWNKLGLTEEEKTELSEALSQQTKEKIKTALNIVSPSKIPSSIIIDGWHDVEKELPKENGLYLVTTKTKIFKHNGEDCFGYDVEICEYYCGNFEIACCEVIAWTECPQPYRKEV